MPRQARAAYLAGARDLEALATLASGENPDGTAFTLPTDATATSADTTMQSAAAATGNGTAVATSGMAVLGIQVTGTFVGTITWEATIDGTNWVAVPFTDAATGLQSTTATAPGIYNRRVGAFKQVRARVSAYGSGAITATGHALAEGDVGMVPAALYGKSSAAGDTALLVDGSGNLRSTIYSGANQASVNNFGDGAFGSGSALYVVAVSGRFNNTNWDRERNNSSSTLLASAARTTTQNATFTNFNGRGVRVDLSVSAGSGFSLVVKIQSQDSVSGAWIDVLTTATPITTTGQYTFRVYPGLTPVTDRVVSDILGRACRVRIEVADATSATYSLACDNVL